MPADETDRRFQELIGNEFGSDADPQPSKSPPAEKSELFSWTDPDPEPKPEPEYTLDHVELTDADYPPSEPRPPAEPVGLAGLSLLAKLGVGLLGYGLVAGLFTAVIWRLPTWISWTIPVAFLAGVVLLLTRLPWRRSPDDDGGARL